MQPLYLESLDALSSIYEALRVAVSQKSVSVFIRKFGSKRGKNIKQSNIKYTLITKIKHCLAAN